MADNNQDITKFTIFMTFDAISLFITWKLANKFFFNQQNYMIALAAISIPWIQTIVILVLKYQFFYIKWIQIGFSIVTTLLSLTYMIWKSKEQNQQELNQSPRESKVPLLGYQTTYNQDQISNYGLNLEIATGPTLQKKLLLQLFQSKTELDQLEAYNIKWNDYVGYYNYNLKDLNEVFENLIDCIPGSVYKNKNSQQIKFQLLIFTNEISLLNQIKTIQKNLLNKGKINEEFCPVRIGFSSFQNPENDCINLILSENIIGYHLVNKEMKNIRKFHQDLSDYNFKSDGELCLSQFDDQYIGIFLAFIINELVIQNIGKNYRINESKWSDYVKKFNFLKNSDQLQQEQLNQHLIILGDYFNCKFMIRIFKIGINNKLELLYINKGKEKPLNIFLDIEKKQIGFEIIKNPNINQTSIPIYEIQSQDEKQESILKKDNIIEQQPLEGQTSLQKVSQITTYIMNQDLNKQQQLESNKNNDQFEQDQNQVKNQAIGIPQQIQGEQQQCENLQNHEDKHSEKLDEIEQNRINKIDNLQYAKQNQSIKNIKDDQSHDQTTNTQFTVFDSQDPQNQNVLSQLQEVKQQKAQAKDKQLILQNDKQQNDQGQKTKEEQSQENITIEQQPLQNVYTQDIIQFDSPPLQNANAHAIIQIESPPQKQNNQGQKTGEEQSQENITIEQQPLQNVYTQDIIQFDSPPLQNANAHAIIQIESPPQKQNNQGQKTGEEQSQENITIEQQPLQNVYTQDIIQIDSPPQKQNDQGQKTEEEQSKENIIDQQQPLQTANTHAIIQIDSPPQNQNDQGQKTEEEQSKENITIEQQPLQNANTQAIIQIESPPQKQNNQGQKTEEEQSKENIIDQQQPLQDANTQAIIQIDSPPQKQNDQGQKTEEEQSKENITIEQQPLQNANTQAIIQIDSPPQKQNDQGQKSEEEQSKENIIDQQQPLQDANTQAIIQIDSPPQKQNDQGQKEEEQSKGNIMIEQQPLQNANTQAIIQIDSPPQKQNDQGQKTEEEQSKENIIDQQQPLQTANTYAIIQIDSPPQNQNDQGQKSEEEQSKENIIDQQQPLQDANTQAIIQIDSPPQKQNDQGQKTEQEQLKDNIIDQQQPLQNANTQAIASQNNDDMKQFYNYQPQLQNQQGKSYPIINQKFYNPSFKQRLVEEEYLKKFIRDLKNIKEYQEEYNLDESQDNLLKKQIKFFFPIRGDGNCLFTSIGFQYLYYNLIDPLRYERLQNIIDSTEFKQNYEHQSVETSEDQDILRQEFKIQLQRLITIKNPQQLLQQIAQQINNDEGSFYGLLIIFMRNYFRKILQDFYDTSEEKFLIQNPDQINEIITWEFMYDETDIALKVFATQEQILIRCYQKMNIDDRIVNICEYNEDGQNEYKIGLAFQPGHYNAVLLNS